jgi:lipoprotein signal peptidase
MATVLQFDPHARRRTPATPLRRPVDGERPLTGERVVPFPTHREIERPRPSVRATVVESAEEAVQVVAAAPAAMTEGALAVRFFPLVGAVALADLATKALAVDALTDRTVAVAGPLALHLVYNTASAGGVWLGAHTRELNLVATGVVIGLLVMLVPILARIDRRSWAALALMAGGGVGNLTSLATSSRGVPDFLAFRHPGGAWVLNVADVLMLAGLVLLGRTVLVLARAIRAERAAARPHRPAAGTLTAR